MSNLVKVAGAAGVTAVGAFGLVLGLVITAATSDDGADGAGDLLDTKEIPSKYVSWVQKAGRECAEVNAPLIAAQIEAESGWKPTARSPVGAAGLSQFMPGTWRTWGVDAASKSGAATPDGKADPLTPGDAIMTQARYDCALGEKVKDYKAAGRARGDTVRLLLAAYNAGPGAVAEHHGVPPYAETQQYVRRILSLREKYAQDSGDDAGASGPRGQRIVAAAKKWTGTPYAWGGGSVDGPSHGIAQGRNTVGFDCSSLVQYAVYHGSGKKTIPPRTSQAQATHGKPVSSDDLRPGDIVVFEIGGSYSHVGIYVGDGQMINAPRTGKTVEIASITDGYYASKPQKYRRY